MKRILVLATMSMMLMTVLVSGQGSADSGKFLECYIGDESSLCIAELGGQHPTHGCGAIGVIVAYKQVGACFLGYDVTEVFVCVSACYEAGGREPTHYARSHTVDGETVAHEMQLQGGPLVRTPQVWSPSMQGINEEVTTPEHHQPVDSPQATTPGHHQPRYCPDEILCIHEVTLEEETIGGDRITTVDLESETVPVETPDVERQMIHGGGVEVGEYDAGIVGLGFEGGDTHYSAATTEQSVGPIPLIVGTACPSGCPAYGAPTLVFSTSVGFEVRAAGETVGHEESIALP